LISSFGLKPTPRIIDLVIAIGGGSTLDGGKTL
jgi:alcohol dehydrogenase class IV